VLSGIDKRLTNLEEITAAVYEDVRTKGKESSEQTPNPNTDSPRGTDPIHMESTEESTGK